MKLSKFFIFIAFVLINISGWIIMIKMHSDKHCLKLIESYTAEKSAKPDSVVIPEILLKRKINLKNLLKLSRDQITFIQEDESRNSARFSAMSAGIMKSLDEMETELLKNKVIDQKKVASLMRDFFRQNLNLRMELIKRQNRIRTVLTDEQIEKINEFIKSRIQRNRSILEKEFDFNF